MFCGGEKDVGRMFSGMEIVGRLLLERMDVSMLGNMGGELCIWVMARADCTQVVMRADMCGGGAYERGHCWGGGVGWGGGEGWGGVEEEVRAWE